jgi:hypothetical protein
MEIPKGHQIKILNRIKQLKAEKQVKGNSSEVFSQRGEAEGEGEEAKENEYIALEGRLYKS